MATVTGYTAPRMKEIEDTTIVDGNVVGNDLVLVRRDGVTINAGNVRGAQGPTGSTGDTAIVVATSATRPGNPYTGQFVYETDTHRIFSYNGSAWVYRGGVIICTSTTRPASPFAGLAIYETDTNRLYTYDGAGWVYRGGVVICLSATRPVNPFAGLSIYETDTNRPFTWDGTTWVYRGGVILCTSTTRPGNPFNGLSIYETDTGRPFTWQGSWIYRGGIVVCTDTTRPTSPVLGMQIYQTNNHRIFYWNGSSWWMDVGYNPIKVKVVKTAAQVIGSASVSNIVWDAEWFDQDGLWAPGSLADQLIIPAGIGAFHWRVTFIGSISPGYTGARVFGITHNGANTAVLNMQGGGWYSGGSLSVDVACNPGDSIRVYGYQNSGYNLNFSIDYPMQVSMFQLSV